MDSIGELGAELTPDIVARQLFALPACSRIAGLAGGKILRMEVYWEL